MNLHKEKNKFKCGNSFLNPLTKPGECSAFLANVTFEPGCRNNWHIHHAKSGGGQILINLIAFMYMVQNKIRNVGMKE